MQLYRPRRGSGARPSAGREQRFGAHATLPAASPRRRTRRGDGGALFDQQSERQPGTFYLTDFLAHHYEGLVIESLGLDRYPELRDTFFGNYEELLYLRQLPDQDESERARAAATRLGLAYKQVDSGLDVLEERLVALIESEDR